MAGGSVTRKKLVSQQGGGTAPGGGTPVGIIGSGTVNKVAKFIAGTTIGDSIIYDDGVNIGINTTTPTARLDINHSPTNFVRLGTSQQIIQESATNFIQFSYSGIGDLYLMSENIQLSNAITGKTFSNNGTAIGALFAYNTYDYTFKNYDTSNINYFEVSHVGFFENRLGINMKSPTATIHAQGLNSLSSNSALKLDNVTTNILNVKNNGTISMPLLQTGKVGLVSGDLYVDTAANILANGDKVVGRKT